MVAQTTRRPRQQVQQLLLLRAEAGRSHHQNLGRGRAGPARQMTCPRPHHSVTAVSVGYVCFHTISSCISNTDLTTFTSTYGLKKSVGKAALLEYSEKAPLQVPQLSHHFRVSDPWGTGIWQGARPSSTTVNWSECALKVEIQTRNTAFECKEPNYSNKRRPLSVHFHGQKADRQEVLGGVFTVEKG